MALYQRAIKVEEKLVKASAGNTVAQHNLSVTNNDMGAVLVRLGRPEDALKCFERALEITETRAAGQPNDVKAQFAVSDCYSRIGKLWRYELGDPEAAAEALAKSMEIRERVVAAAPGNSWYEQALAGSYVGMGDVQVQSGMLDAGLVFYRKAQAIGEALAAQDPQNVLTRRELSVVYNRVGDTLVKLGDLSGGLEGHKQALQITERLVAGNPHDVGLEYDLSVSYEKMGNLQRTLGKLQDALENYRKAHRISEKLAASDQDNAGAQRGLAISFYKLGQVNKELENFPEAMKSYQAGMAIVTAEIEKGQSVKDAKSLQGVLERAAASARLAEAALGDWDALLKQPEDLLAKALEMRALLLSKKARFAEAAQAAKKLRELDDVGHVSLYNIACVFGRCAASVKAAEGEELAADQAKLRAAWAADSLAALKEAMDAGYDDLDHMRKDPDLNAIRGLPEFKMLIEERKVSESK